MPSGEHPPGSSTDAFMDDLFAGLGPNPPPKRILSPATNCPMSNRKCGGTVLKRNSSVVGPTKAVELPALNSTGSNCASPHAKTDSFDLLQGIEDWSDFSHDEPCCGGSSGVPIATPNKCALEHTKSIGTPHFNPSKTLYTTPKAKTDIMNLFEGIDDWGDISPDEDSPGNKSPVQEFVPLFKQYITCRVQTVDSAANWNPTNARMERHVRVSLGSDENSIQKSLLLCDEWSETALETNNTLNIVSLPGSPPVNLQLDPLVFSRDEPGHVIILFPSVLVNATAVSNAPACPRRSVLGHLLKGGPNDIGEAIVRGNIVHDIIQTLLLPKEVDELPSTTSDTGTDKWQMACLMKEARRACIRHVNALFAIGKSIDEGIKMISEHIAELPAWSSRYLIKRESNGDILLNKDACLSDPRSTVRQAAARPKIGITDIIDIEEEIWSPKYGLKGKIDATVQCAIMEEPLKSNSLRLSDKHGHNTNLFPLEIKTGKRPSGMEHLSQTMLYTLLMSDRYNIEIPAGLLLYTSSNELTRVRAVKQELRHLLITRNHLASYMHHQPVYPVQTSANSQNLPVDIEDLAAPEPLNEKSILPEPIDDDRACRRCYAVDGCMLYRKTVEGVDSIPPERANGLLSQFYQHKTSHLTPSHTEFFRRWEALITLEERELGKLKRDIWELTAEKRQKQGTSFTDMVIDYSFDAQSWLGGLNPGSKIHRYTYCLVPSSTSAEASTVTVSPATTTKSRGLAHSLLSGQMSNHDPIVVSIEGKNLALGRGFILDLTPRRIIIGLDHRLGELESIPTGVDQPIILTPRTRRQPSLSSTHYCIDKDELMTGMGRIRDNLAQMFLEHGSHKLRELVVDLRKPEFMPMANPGEFYSDAPSHLNEDQRRVIRKVLCAQDYALVLGMPGTGKTTTIAELIKTLAQGGKTILLSSYTHSAVDTILAKLIGADINFLRLGNVDRISAALRPYTLDDANSPQTVEELEKTFMTPRVVGTTSLSITHPLFVKRTFDYCIVDEASQITLPTCLGPLRYAKTFVLVGDHFQLPPLVKNTKAKAGGLETSLFKLLTEAHPDAVVSLNMQYRMNKDIMSLSNALIYDGRLRCADERTSDLSLDVPLGIDYDLIHAEDSAPCVGSCWILDLLQPERKVVFVDTDQLQAQESKFGKLVQNGVEASLAFQLVKALTQGGVAESSIGLITPYRLQVKLLANLFQDMPQIEIMTADKSQGRDKDCIIMTMVRNNGDEQVGELLKDWRRINVCLTRAKKKLVIIGSKQTLKHSDVLNNFFEFIGQRNWIYELERGCEKLHRSLSTSASTAAVNIASDKISLRDATNLSSAGHAKRRGDDLQSPSVKLSSPKKGTPASLVKACKSYGVLRDVAIDILDENGTQNL